MRARPPVTRVEAGHLVVRTEIEAADGTAAGARSRCGCPSPTPTCSTRPPPPASPRWSCWPRCGARTSTSRARSTPAWLRGAPRSWPSLADWWGLPPPRRPDRRRLRHPGRRRRGRPVLHPGRRLVVDPARPARRAARRPGHPPGVGAPRHPGHRRPPRPRSSPATAPSPPSSGSSSSRWRRPAQALLNPHRRWIDTAAPALTGAGLQVAAGHAPPGADRRPPRRRPLPDRHRPRPDRPAAHRPHRGRRRQPGADPRGARRPRARLAPGPAVAPGLLGRGHGGELRPLRQVPDHHGRAGHRRRPRPRRRLRRPHRSRPRPPAGPRARDGRRSWPRSSRACRPPTRSCAGPGPTPGSGPTTSPPAPRWGDDAPPALAGPPPPAAGRQPPCGPPPASPSPRPRRRSAGATAPSPCARRTTSTTRSAPSPTPTPTGPTPGPSSSTTSATAPATATRPTSPWPWPPTTVPARPTCPGILWAHLDPPVLDADAVRSAAPHRPGPAVVAGRGRPRTAAGPRGDRAGLPAAAGDARRRRPGPGS